MLCFRCEIDLPLFNNEQVVEHILGGRVPVRQAAIYLKFYAGGQTQRLLHELKYRSNLDLGKYLGKRFMQHGSNAEHFKHIDVIVPIPLHAAKFKQRGYNQSAIIAHGIGQVLDRPVQGNSVIRTRKSETQTRKTRDERWQNVSGIFECQGNALEGRHILVVDDVITTGATMEACAQAILEAGAESASFAVLATAMK